MKTLAIRIILIVITTIIYSTLTSTQLISKPTSYNKNKKISMKLWGTDYNANYGEEMYRVGHADPNNDIKVSNTYLYYTTCFDLERYEVYGNANNVTISIECGKDRKRVYFRKNQNIKGVLKIHASEVGTEDCYFYNAEDSPDENGEERLNYYFLILDNEGNELFRGEFYASECEG